MARRFRRVVTGHNSAGTAVVVSDGAAAAVLERPGRPGVTLTDFWRTTTCPAELDGPEETTGGPFLLRPPARGTVFRVVEFEPEDPEVLKTVAGRDAFAEMGAADSIVENARHPFMHRTDSVDYAVVLNGEITMLLDDSEVRLEAGDVVVQRGTNHAWSNRSSEPCRIAFVLVDAVPRAAGSS